MSTFAVSDQKRNAASCTRRGVPALGGLLIAFISLFLSTCKESLPPYQPPTLLFEGTLEPFYSLTARENALHLIFKVRNVFDETLEGKGEFTGQVQLVALRDPTVTKTFILSESNIISGGGYNPAFGTLRIDPGDSIVFDVVWNLSQRPLLGDKGEELTSSLLNLQPDKECGAREISQPEVFAVQGSVQIFAVGSPVVARQTVFQLCLVSAWVNPRDCPPVGSPCNMIISTGE